jgi:probable HAF family extracellular repeat protein
MTRLGTYQLQLVCILLIGYPLYAAPMYSVVRLGSFGAARSEAFGVSRSGMAAGTSRTANPQMDIPVVFDGATMRALSSSAGQANGVNASGTVAGTTYTGSGARATVWTDNEERLLPTLGGAQSYGLAINDAGNVAGSSATGSGSAHAFLTIGDEIRDLGTLGGDWSSAYGLNNSLEVVGYSLTSSGTFGAFIWTPETGMLPIPTLGGANGYAFAINETGSVVGASTTMRGTVEGFVYESGAVQSLGTLGGYGSYAYGINASNHIVGYSYDQFGRSRAFVWLDGIMYDLNAMSGGLDGWILDAAYGINESGQIVGSGTYQGVTTAFRLDPIRADPVFQDLSPALAPASPEAVPEPGTSILLLMGTVLLWLWRIDRRAQH